MHNHFYRDQNYGVWEGIVHPSGVLYYFDASTVIKYPLEFRSVACLTARQKTYTGSDIKKYTSDRLNNLQDWIGAARRRLQEDAWYMVVEPVATEDGDYYEYYCAVPDARIITWFEDFNADLLFQECAFAREWNHKRRFYYPINTFYSFHDCVRAGARGTILVRTGDLMR
jgi:hypothetical protein